LWAGCRPDQHRHLEAGVGVGAWRTPSRSGECARLATSEVMPLQHSTTAEYCLGYSSVIRCHAILFFYGACSVHTYVCNEKRPVGGPGRSLICAHTFVCATSSAVSSAVGPIPRSRAG